MDDKDAIRQQIRARLEAGTLPRSAPPLTKAGTAPPTTRQAAAIKADSAIGLARCAGCDDPGAGVTYRYPDGKVVRFHGRCHRIWEEECQRV
jgi:hypothetical protein